MLARLSHDKVAAIVIVTVLRWNECRVHAETASGTIAPLTAGDAKCVCSGSNKDFNISEYSRFNNSELFPADYGTRCKSWDKVDCPKAWPGETLGPWCCASWCYVSNASCPDAIASVVSPGLFYAYAGPCGANVDEVNATNCPLHHSWDLVSSRASMYVKDLLNKAANSVATCKEEDEDTDELKSSSYILGIAIIGSGFGVLLFVWVIQCDIRQVCSRLCARSTKVEERAESKLVNV